MKFKKILHCEEFKQTMDIFLIVLHFVSYFELFFHRLLQTISVSISLHFH